MPEDDVELMRFYRKTAWAAIVAVGLLGLTIGAVIRWLA